MAARCVYYLAYIRLKRLTDYVCHAKRHIYIYTHAVHETFLTAPYTDPNTSGTNEIKETVRQLRKHDNQ